MSFTISGLPQSMKRVFSLVKGKPAAAVSSPFFQQFGQAFVEFLAFFVAGEHGDKVELGGVFAYQRVFAQGDDAAVENQLVGVENGMHQHEAVQRDRKSVV